MGGPIGLGVFKALDEERRRAGGGVRAPRAPGQGWWYFILTTLCLSWLTAAISPGSAVAVAGALGVLCLQALTEEYGWRGTPLAYAIERWGVRAGLIVHGLMWGAWYAPLFLLSSPSPVDSLPAAGGFAITCLLLGIVFGWLRLRSRSIAPSAIANALLTIVAGLPLLLQDGSSGIRDAVFRGPGWPVIGIAALLVLVLRRRDLEPAPAAR
jgi:uncharacterized protein